MIQTIPLNKLVASKRNVRRQSDPLADAQLEVRREHQIGVHDDVAVFQKFVIGIAQDHLAMVMPCHAGDVRCGQYRQLAGDLRRDPLGDARGRGQQDGG